MRKLENLVRQNILDLSPYSSARNEFQGTEGIFLDANENPFGDFNRYPDPYQNELKAKLGQLKDVAPKNIFVGNGSDEIIDLALRIFCNPGQDKVLVFSPTYGMYEVLASINNIEIKKIPLNAEFQIDVEKVREYLSDSFLKMVFICSPNNPTGNLMNKTDVEFLLNNFDGIVFIDEAYIDFTSENSAISLIDRYKNLIVSQTLSKAWGLAGVRIGLAYANEAIISIFNKVKPPYNISQLNQNEAVNVLNDGNKYRENLEIILSEKHRLKVALEKLILVKRIYPSDANFLLIEVEDANAVYNSLVRQQVVVRNRNSEIPNSLRISIGSPEENEKLINALNKIK